MDGLVLVRGGVLADLPLPAGTVLRGRVLPDRALMLDGVRFPAATLPDDLAEGLLLRLRVEAATGDQLHLKVLEAFQPPAQQPGPAQQPQPPVAYPLPGGAQLLVHRDGGEGGRGGRRAGEPPALTVRFDAPRLGRLDVRLEPGAAAVHVTAGRPADEVRAAAAVLAEALARATERPTQVTVHPRGLDVRA
jgi:hypothetical protein